LLLPLPLVFASRVCRRWPRARETVTRGMALAWLLASRREDGDIRSLFFFMGKGRGLLAPSGQVFFFLLSFLLVPPLFL
jgi:hypothetical protein